MRIARLVITALLLAAPTGLGAEEFTLSAAHQAAVNRQRRIFFQYDPAADIQLKGGFGADMEPLMGYVFDFADMPGSQLDAICIDVSNEGVAHYRSRILRPIEHPGLVKWRAEGLDSFDALIRNGHARGKEIWWGLRMNEVERGDLAAYEPGRYADFKERNPTKKAHPDWLIRSWQSLDLLCGVFGNYLHQAADGVGIFNNPAGSAEHAARLGLSQQATYDPRILTTCGSLATIAGKPRYHALDRRGGYAHNEGHGSANSHAQLPVTLRYDGTPCMLTLPLWEPVEPGTAATLRLVLFNHVEGDDVAVRFNGSGLTRSLVDPQWKDARIFSPLPQPETVTPGNLVKNLATQQLTRVELAVPVESLKRGANELAISVQRTGPFPASKPVTIEKVELHLEGGATR